MNKKSDYVTKGMVDILGITEPPSESVKVETQRPRHGKLLTPSSIDELNACALNVWQETGFTPRQLAEQRKELLEALKLAANGLDRVWMDSHSVAVGKIKDVLAIASEAGSVLGDPENVIDGSR